VTIHYTPTEFHSSLIKHQLIVDTNQGPQLFTLVVNIPFEYLSLCSNLQPQIQFESFVYKLLVTFIVVILTFLGVLTKRELIINLESCTIFENLHSKVETPPPKSPITPPVAKQPTPPPTPQGTTSTTTPTTTTTTPPAPVKEPQGERCKSNIFLRILIFSVNKSNDSLGDKTSDVAVAKKRSGSESDKKGRNRKGSSTSALHANNVPQPTTTAPPVVVTKEKKKKEKQTTVIQLEKSL
jgi:hypothetical protein